MANGIRLSDLRKSIAANGTLHTTQEVLAAHRASSLQKLSVRSAYDGEWLALPINVWHRIITHLGAYQHVYGSDIAIAGDTNDQVRKDCDDYMAFVKGRAGLELSANGVVNVLDYSSGHAYCAALVRARPKQAPVSLVAFEPQLNAPRCFAADTLLGRHKNYLAQSGEVRF